MEFLDNKQHLTGGSKKIDEYVRRIKGGESKDSIFQGLPESFILSIEKGLAEPVKEIVGYSIEDIPPQYIGFDSETLEFIWTFPEYVDQEETKALMKKKAMILLLLREKESAEKAKNDQHRKDQEKIEELRTQLGITEQPKSIEVQEAQEVKESPVSVDEIPLLNLGERKKLYGWTASYELAKIAKQQGIDLSEISREDYATFAIQNSLAIDDDQLRVAPWQRTGTSVQEIVLERKKRKTEIREESEREFAKFCYDIQQKAGQEDRMISESIRVRQGTKDSNHWLFFAINEGAVGESNETYKAYASVKDLNTLTPERFTEFMGALRDAKYNGDIKIFQDLTEQGVNLNDQIVMHGGSQADAELALEVAQVFFGNDLVQTSFGKDAVIDGKNKSYSQVLAKRIFDAINSKTQ